MLTYNEKMKECKNEKIMDKTPIGVFEVTILIVNYQFG
jgi:hypothetical protein